jgi:hypothetical protein
MPHEHPFSEPQPASLATADREAETNDAQEESWLEDLAELPPRPRRRLLTPAPLALLAVLLGALGFIGGVLVEKGQGTPSSSAGSALASRLRGLPGTAGAGAGIASAAGGSPGASGGGSRPTSGTVSYVSGNTLYVTDAESHTVKVTASAATSVTKTVKTAVGSIHPGETVTVTGSSSADGTLSAESIRVGSAGGLGELLGGAGGKGGTAGSSAGSAAGAGTEGPALFGGG